MYINRNKIQKWKLDIKLFIRKFLPKFVLGCIRRPQIPPQKVHAFLEAYKNKIIHTNSIPRTLAVVVPCFNHARFLEMALASIQKQTRAPDEIILINDNSRDNTSKILQRFITEYPARISSKTKLTCIDNEKNIGQAASINKGIVAATSDLVMILNDDDYLMHDVVEAIFFLFTKHPQLALIGGGTIPFRYNMDIHEKDAYIKDRCAVESIALDITSPQDALTFENFCDLNMTHTSSTFVHEKAISCGMYLPKKDRVVKYADRDFQIRMNLLYPTGTKRELPFCFWRMDSSVDDGKFS